MEKWPMLNFSERKRNETSNTILNTVHISSLNTMILKSEDITGKKSCKQILMHWKWYCKKTQTKPRVSMQKRISWAVITLCVYSTEKVSPWMHLHVYERSRNICNLPNKVFTLLYVNDHFTASFLIDMNYMNELLSLLMGHKWKST